MKTFPFPVLLLAVVVGGLAGAGTVAALGGAESADAVDLEPSRTGVASAAPVSIVEDLADLKRQNEQLLARIAALESRRPAETRRFGGKALVTREELDGLAEEMRNLVAERAVPARELETKVADTLQAIREKENSVRARKKRDARRIRMERSLENLQKRLNLDSRQVADLRELHERRHAREEEMTRLWESGRREGIGQMKREMFEEHDAGLARILTPQQLETYRAMGRDGK